MRSSTRPLTDILMVILFILLMADQHTGNGAHEWLGIFLFAAFLLHTWLNRAWYKTLTKGRYNASRTFRLLLNALLLLSLAGTIASAVPISRTVFAFAEFEGELFLRTLHVCCAHWCFLLAAAHLGLYWKRFCTSFLQHMPFSRSGRYSRVSFVLCLTIALHGVYAFHCRELIFSLTMQSSFMPWNENTALFLLDYSTIFFLCSWTASSLLSLITAAKGMLCPPISKCPNESKKFSTQTAAR